MRVKRILAAKTSGDVRVTRVTFVGFVRFCVKVVGDLVVAITLILFIVAMSHTLLLPRPYAPLAAARMGKVPAHGLPGHSRARTLG